MLLLLLLPALAGVTAVELWMTDHDALDAASAAYDRSLLGAAKSIAGNISTASGGLSVELPYRLFEYFELTANGPVHFRVATSDGLVELGSADLPPPPHTLAVDVPVFYDALYFGESVRLAALLTSLEQPVAQSQSRNVLIQIAESTQSRQEFTRRFVLRSLYRDLLVFGLTLMAVVVSVRLAVDPLARLASQVRGRRPDDLTPIEDDSLSADVQPLVQAVNQQILRTQELGARQQQFIDDASHQLRTHLTTLHVQAEHALGETDPVQLRHTLEALRTEIGRATRSTNQFLALARSDALGLETREFDMPALVKDVAMAVMALARRKGIDLGMSERDMGTMSGYGDADLLREALLNLASNAVAYTHEGGEVTLGFAMEQGLLMMTVTDNGPGLDAAERETLGERFRRSGARADSGSGLGLAIARSIARKHGGNLELEPRADGAPGLHARIWWPHRPVSMGG